MPLPVLRYGTRLAHRASPPRRCYFFLPLARCKPGPAALVTCIVLRGTHATKSGIGALHACPLITTFDPEIVGTDERHDCIFARHHRFAWSNVRCKIEEDQASVLLVCGIGIH
jgi:hypothetical protein